MAKKQSKYVPEPWMVTDKLSPKELAFCREYIVNGLNAVKAALAVGYSKNYANNARARLLKRPKIKKYINTIGTREAKKAGLTREKVMEHLSACVEADRTELFDENGQVKNIHEIPDELKKLIDGVEMGPVFDKKGQYLGQAVRKIKFAGKLGGLELSTKVLGMLAPEKKEHLIKASIDVSTLQGRNFAEDELDSIDADINSDALDDDTRSIEEEIEED